MLGGPTSSQRAAGVEYALANTKRVSILGALRKIQGRSAATDSEDAKPDDFHDDHEAPCEACGSLGQWTWGGCTATAAVATNGGWGLVRAPP